MSVRAGFSRLFDRLKPVRTLVLLLLACAHTPPPPPVPPPLVPRAAVDMMCTRMHAEGMSGELRALKMSQPLITPPAIEALASAMFYSGRATPQITAYPSVPVETSGSCVTRAIDSISGRDADVMVAQFSSPFENPFVRGQLGVLARLSLGNEAATWYWIPIGQRNGAWGAANPLMLAVRD